jgi:hypothetical protein
MNVAKTLPRIAKPGSNAATTIEISNKIDQYQGIDCGNNNLEYKLVEIPIILASIFLSVPIIDLKYFVKITIREKELYGKLYFL